MRIVAGRHRGRAISAPAGLETRPTADRVRESLFNILEHGDFAADGSPFRDRRILDAFAGTGALGLEALSRGAAHASFMELGALPRRVLAENIAALGETAQTTIIAGDATRPAAAPAPVALALLDPPYGKELGSKALAALARQGWLEPGALAVVEIGVLERFPALEGFTTLDERRYGVAKLVFLRWSPL